MRRHWISLEPSASLYEAERLMRLARIRQVPVVLDGILLGLLGYRELLAATIDHLAGRADGGAALTVADVIERTPAVIEPGASLAAAAECMARAGVGCVPVVEPTEAGTALVGLVTEADLLRVAYDPLSAAEWA